MILYVEIALTIWAWKNGYKGWALLPLAFAVLIGYLIGSYSPGLVESGNLLSLIWIDLLAIVALILMIASKSLQEPNNELLDQDSMAGNVEEV